MSGIELRFKSNLTEEMKERIAKYFPEATKTDVIDNRTLHLHMIDMRASFHIIYSEFIRIDFPEIDEVNLLV